MYRSLICLGLSLLSYHTVFSQTSARGRVVSDSSGHLRGISGVGILIPSTGESTSTDTGGWFRFAVPAAGHLDIVAIFANGERDTFMYHPPHIKEPLLVKDIAALADAVVKGRKEDSHIHSRGVYKKEILNEGEFKKAACCTLSESFETNNTVEVSNADGVSGIRQVEMLGLSGRYVLMTRDNIPVVRGLNVLTGLDQIPGPMVSGVHIAKGAGSVTNGFEGMTGGINYALKSEPEEPRIFLNGYYSSQYRAEGNLIASQRIGKRTFNHAYLHYRTRYKPMDYGKDGFADLPVGSQVYIGDIVKYYGKKFETQIGASYVLGRKDGGSLEAVQDTRHRKDQFFFSQEEERMEAFVKLGIFLDDEGKSSIGNIFIVSQTRNDAILNNLIGREYNGLQRNISYTGLWGTPDDALWSFKSGVNIVYDDVEESYSDSFSKMYRPSRTEYSAGLFSEVVYKAEKLNWILGLRADHNNLYGAFVTPRFHLKYDVTKTQQFHFQAGMGRRTPWVFADNLPLLISNRRLVIENTASVPGRNPAYGLPMEQALNGGISYTWHLMVFKLPSTLSADGFYTHFLNQTVADRDQDPGTLIISNQHNNATVLFQLDWDLKPHRRIDLKLSYRYVNSQMTLGGIQRLQTMQAPHRALIVAGYETRKKWYFDLVTQVNSPKRMPSTTVLSEVNQREVQSPWYTILNFQIRKDWKSWEFYTGAENILNTIQANPILNVTEAGHQYFDAAFAWGPTMGRNFYAGFRFKLK